MLDSREKGLVLQAWKERWSDAHWMEALIESKHECDLVKLSNALLDLMFVGSSPNDQLVRYLDLAIACQAIPLCSLINCIQSRAKGESLYIVDSLVTIVTNHIHNLRDESDSDDSTKLPTCIVALIEWMVYLQVDAMKMLNPSTESHCLSIFRGCSRIITCIADDILLKSLAPLWGKSKWQTLTSTSQNIHIPIDACSDAGKKILASSLVSFVKCLEQIQDTTVTPPSIRHLFNLPCKMFLYYDTLYRNHCSNTHVYFKRIAKHYGCSIQKVCVEWGKAHLNVILDNDNCKELMLTLLLYKLPRVLSEVFTSTKQSEAVVIGLFEENIMWYTVAARTNCKMVLPLLQILLQYNLISPEAFEVLKERHASDHVPSAFINSLKNAERMLREITDTLSVTSYTTATTQHIISLLERVSNNNNSFTQQFDKMFYVAVAKGELEGLVTGLCNTIDSTCDGCLADHTEEQSRIAVFDICCLILVRCCMMFGTECVPESSTFCKWLGSHVCSPYNPLQTLLPLLHPPHPVHHKENVNMLVESFSTDRKLNTVSLQNVVIAFPDALKDIMVGIKSKVISDDKFNQQTAVVRNYLLSPVFVAIHWLVHYSESIEDELKYMTKILMKPFLKQMSAYTSTVLLAPRAELLQMSLNSTISIQDSKKNLIKKPYWVTPPDRGENTETVWSDVCTNPTLGNISRLYISDNIPNIIQRAAVETLSVPLSGDIKHTVFIAAIFLQTDPRYVPWLLRHTLPELLNDGLPSHRKCYIWALSQLTFLAIDLYLTNINNTELNADRTGHAHKKLCRNMELQPVLRPALLDDALSAFWRDMTEISREEGYSYSTSFLHRFIRYGIEGNRGRLQDIISNVTKEDIRSIAVHLMEHELAPDGVTLLMLAGYDHNQCSAVLQSVL